MVRLLRGLQFNRAQKSISQQDTVDLKAGRLHVVYFWSDHCAQCKQAQAPILDRLMEQVNREKVALIALRIEDHETLVKKWGVRTLPTTYVLDQQGNVMYINNGLASESRLLEQLKLNTVSVE